jgi:hypothetical protein
LALQAAGRPKNVTGKLIFDRQTRNEAMVKIPRPPRAGRVIKAVKERFLSAKQLVDVSSAHSVVNRY